MAAMTRDDLIAFEADVAAAFNAGRIRAPVHLSGNNEDQLLEIFRDVGPNDWIATQWRSHYHCLLRGVPPDRLMADILAGRSITLTYPDYRIISSAIVGGVLPIALGIAWAIKRDGGSEKVWAFCGDMTAMTGMFCECAQYAWYHRLPLQFVVEDNGKSVCTDTFDTWKCCDPLPEMMDVDVWRMIRRYRYELPWPHSGAGRRVEF